MKLEKVLLKKGSPFGYKAVVKKPCHGNDPDWRGLYVAESIVLAKNYVLESGDEIKKAVLKEDLQIIVCDDKRFKSLPGGVEKEMLMKELRKEIFKQLNIDLDPRKNFTEALAEQGYAFGCFNNDDKETGQFKEIFIPETMKHKIRLDEYATCRVDPDSKKNRVVLNYITNSSKFNAVAHITKKEVDTIPSRNLHLESSAPSKTSPAFKFSR